MDFEKVVRKPFVVEATRVTEENIEEIAKLVGELRHQAGKPYIQVNRNVVPGVYRVHPGYWMTRMGDNIRCYNERVFDKQFCAHTSEIEEWVDFINGVSEPVSDDSVPLLEPETPSLDDADSSAIIDTSKDVPQTEIKVVVNGGD